MKNLVTDRRLWLTAGEDRVVEDGDPAAAFLLVGHAGRTIPADVAARLELDVVDGRIVYPGAPDIEGAQGAGETDEEDEPKTHRFGGSTDAAEEEEAEAEEEAEEELEAVPDWPDRVGPEAYLERYPTGPKAELARAVIAAEDGADGGP